MRKNVFGLPGVVAEPVVVVDARGGGRVRLVLELPGFLGRCRGDQDRLAQGLEVFFFFFFAFLFSRRGDFGADGREQPRLELVTSLARGGPACDEVLGGFVRGEGRGELGVGLGEGAGGGAGPGAVEAPDEFFFFFFRKEEVEVVRKEKNGRSTTGKRRRAKKTLSAPSLKWLGTHLATKAPAAAPTARVAARIGV